jgi:hypothetical protein
VENGKILIEYKLYSKEFDMTIHEIEKAITEISPEELAHFREWFEEFDAQVWDEQCEQDATSGKFDELASKAKSDFHTGKAKEL